VEDRLIFDGVKTTSRLKEKYRQSEHKAYNYTRRDKSKDNVVDRLYHYKEMYDARKLDKQLKVIESVRFIH